MRRRSLSLLPAKAKKQADDKDESDTATLTSDFTGLSVREVEKYLVDNFADPGCPKRGHRLLPVGRVPSTLLGDCKTVIEGTMRLGPEYGVGMPVNCAEESREFAEPGCIPRR